MGTRKLNAVVAGVGNMGKNHVKNYSEIKSVNLVAISDLNETLGQEMAAKYGCRYYQDHKKMLAQEKPDVASIVVPTRFHHMVGLDFIRAGVHVLMEKPIAMSLPEGQELIQAAEDHNVKLMIGHVERFNPGVIRLKRLIEAGRLGQIVSMSAKRVFVMPNQINDANVLVDLAVHDIDIISYLLGSQPIRVSASGGKAHLQSRDDHAEILLSYNGASGIVQVNWITPVRIRTLEVTGTGGYAKLDYFSKEIELHQTTVTKTVQDYADLLVQFSKPRVRLIQAKEEQPLRLEIMAFLAAIRKDTPPPVTGMDGLKALQIALAAGEDIARNSY